MALFSTNDNSCGSNAAAFDDDDNGEDEDDDDDNDDDDDKVKKWEYEIWVAYFADLFCCHRLPPKPPSLVP